PRRRRRVPGCLRAPTATWTSCVLLLCRGRDRFDDSNGPEPGALCHEERILARRCVEDEEAELVLWNMDRVVEADPRQLVRSRAGAEGARRSRAARSPAWPRARYVSTR